MRVNKMNAIAILIVSFTALGSALAEAGGQGVGNGGDAYQCDDGRVMLLDYYEAKAREIPIDDQPHGPTLRSNVTYLLEKLARFDMERAARYWIFADKILKDFEEFEKNPKLSYGKLVRMTDSILVDINDSKELETPRGCEKIQLVIQQSPHFAEDRLLTIYRPTWNLMSAFQKRSHNNS